MTASVYVIDGGVIALAAWLLLRPPTWLSRRWTRGPTLSFIGTLACCAIATLVGIAFVIALPPDVGAVRYQLLFPFLVTGLIAAAQYRAVHRQLA